MSYRLFDTNDARAGIRRRDVTLANWRDTPFNGWAFSNVRELTPTAHINSRTQSPAIGDMGPILRENAGQEAGNATIGEMLGALSTDVLVVCKDGRATCGWVSPHARADAPHLIFSVSKSITGLIVGLLAEKGILDPGAPVGHYLPECAGSAFEDANIRDLLDMRVSMQVDETYGVDEDWGAKYRRAVLWDPHDSDEGLDLLSLLFAIPKGEEEHGGAFRYRSANTDVLGAVASAAAGRGFHDLASDFLWTPMNGSGEAYISVDGKGTALTAGGISCTAFDLARIGEVMRCGGVADDGKVVLSQKFVEDTLHGGDAQAWATGDWGDIMPGHTYRNQWYARGDGDGCFFATGIHGQWIYVNPKKRVTISKLSSQDAAKDDALNATTLALFDTIAERV